MLPDTEAVPFGDLAALEHKLAARRDSRLSSSSHCRARRACGFLPLDIWKARRPVPAYGTLLVVDEVQTGMYRTGRFLASHDSSAEPDMMILAKALSGGLIPSGALLMSDDVYHSVYGSHRSGPLSIPPLSVKMVWPCAPASPLWKRWSASTWANAPLAAGDFLRTRLREALSGYEMVKEVRGLGLLNGIEFTSAAETSAARFLSRLSARSIRACSAR